MESNSSYKDFTIKCTLGKGSFGIVYKAIKKSDGITYAIKEINLGSMDSNTKQNTLNELRILASIDHPNIVSYKDFFFENNGSKMCIVMEYVGGGDLSHYINNYKKKRIKVNEEIIWNYLIQILEGLKCLHDWKIMHRDIKSANIFISEDLKTIKLGDMNVAKITKNNLAKTQIGTPLYLPPEIWLNKIYDFRCDIFSLGCVLYELTTLNLPFNGNSMDQLRRKILNGIYNRIPSCYSDELYTIIKLLLIKDFKKRPNVYQLFQNPIVQKKKILYNINIENIKNEKLLKTIKLYNIKNLPKIIPKRYSSRAQSAKNLNIKKSNNMNFFSKNNNNIPNISKNSNIVNSKLSNKNSKKLPPKPPNSKRAIPIYKKNVKDVPISNRNNSRDLIIRNSSNNRNNSKDINNRNNSKDIKNKNNIYFNRRNSNASNNSKNNSPMRYRNDTPRIQKYNEELKKQQQKKVNVIKVNNRNRVSSMEKSKPKYRYRPDSYLYWR